MSLYLGENLISGSKPINLGVRNIGEIVSSAIPLTDAGLHLLDGSLIQGGGIYQGFVNYIANIVSIYPDVFTTESAWQNSVSTYGSCGKFVYDSTNNTVRLPKVSDILQGTTDVNALGDLVQAGLPNITGSTYGDTFNGAYGAPIFWGNDGGALYGFKESNSSNVASYQGSASYQVKSVIRIDASRSSSIYKNNFNKVQPQTIKILLYIVIATSSKTDIQVDIDNIATDLNGKADTDLTNVTDQAKILMGSMAMPSDKYIDLTLGASGSTYIAPANGYYQCYIGGPSGYKRLKLFTSGNYLQEAGFSTESNIGFTVPIQKGQTLNVQYSGTLTTRGLGFIYAQGSESEA